MNSTMTRIVSLADPEQKLVIYDGRVAGALGYFVARFAEEREIHQYDLAEQLLFAVDREAKRRPETNRIHFPALFGSARDRCHAARCSAMGIAANLASRERMPSEPEGNRSCPVYVGI